MSTDTAIPGEIQVVTGDPVAVPDPDGFTAQALDFLSDHRWIVPAAIVVSLGVVVALRRRR